MAEQEYECDAGMLSSDDVRTGFISGRTFTNKPVQYSVVDGLAIFEGCIVLGTAAEMERKSATIMAGEEYSGDAGEIAFGVGISGEKYRWPNALVPYDIDPALPNQNRVSDAIAHWEQKTNFRFVLRTTANAGQYPNYVHFRPATGCWSQVGMRGGQQDIGLAGGCGTGSTIHEIGHAIGLWHEQSREDRDNRIVVNWANITAGREHNFNQHITDGDDYGSYDYDSIMHYGAFAFSKNGQPTITTIPPGRAIGQRNGLSTNDIATVHKMYQTWHSNKTVSRTFTSPHSQNAHAYISGIGWRKVNKNSADGVSNMFYLLNEAKASNKKVNVLLDGKFIFQAYMV